MDLSTIAFGGAIGLIIAVIVIAIIVILGADGNPPNTNRPL